MLEGVRRERRFPPGGARRLAGPTVASWLAYLLLLLPAAVHAAPASAPIKPAAAEAAADRVAKAWVDGKGIAGFSIAIWQDGAPVVEKAYGVAHAELGAPTPSGAVYEIASDAKTFTAAAVLRLARQGKLQLDAPLSEYLPDVLPGGVPRQVTLRQLLTHTSGVPEYTAAAGFEAFSTQPKPAEEVLTLVAGQPLLFEPGAAQAYSNTGYLLLGLVVGKVSGVAWADHVERELFGPLGLTGTRASRNFEIIPGLATPYELDGTTLRRAPYHAYELIHGNGGIRSTARDMARWVHALHNGEVLPPDWYAQMLRPAQLRDGTSLRYGLGMVVADKLLGHRAYFHGGTFPGYMSYAAYLPDQRLAVAVLTNTTGPFAENAIAKDVLLDLIGDRSAPPSTVRLRLSDYVGGYTAAVRSKRAMKVAVSGDKLTAFVDPWDSQPREFVAIGPDRFTSEWVDLRFTRAGGRITGVLRTDQVTAIPFSRDQRP